MPTGFDAAARSRTMIEIDAAPDCRDMIHARAAAEAAVPVLGDCDGYSARDFELRRHGTAMTRRASLTSER
jgi:hypothetical protein